MKTRIGKIARVPFEIREELNRRLQNGEMGAPLLNWLNELPDVKKVLGELFGGLPVNKQNLSDWRHGGYQDWLRYQRREEHFQQVTEQGTGLKRHEGGEDVFENFSRIVLAELAEDLDSLDELPNRDQRWKRLREISRTLARLQNGYNHSRRVELQWQKRKDLFEYEDEDKGSPDSTVPSLQSGGEVSPSQPESTAGERIDHLESKNLAELQTSAPTRLPTVESVNRTIYSRQCGYGCICRDCHAEGGKYPHSEVMKDLETSKAMKTDHFLRDGIFFNLTRTYCDCYCGCEKSLAWDAGVRNPPPSNIQTKPHVMNSHGATNSRI